MRNIEVEKSLTGGAWWRNTTMVEIEKSLTGDAWWRNITMVETEGDPQAIELTPNLTSEDKMGIIQSWKTIAVLEVDDTSTPFYVGFECGIYIGFLNGAIETDDGKFGMRFGKNRINFFAFDPEFKKDINIKLCKITTEDDSRYPDLPLY